MKIKARLEGNCKEIMLMMQSVIDGCANEEEKHAVNEHVLHCDSCRRTMQDMMLIRREAADLAAEPPCDLKDRILKRVADENRLAAIRRVRRTKNRTRGITSTVAAAAVIALCVFCLSRYIEANDDAAMMKFILAGEHKGFAPGAEMMESMTEMAADVEKTGNYGDMLVVPESTTTLTEAVYDRETILADIRALIAAYSIEGMYAEVVYANVAELPQGFSAGKQNEVGFYEAADFVSFVSANHVTVNGVQCEFTSSEEIGSCGLGCGGTNVLLILTVD